MVVVQVQGAPGESKLNSENPKGPGHGPVRPYG